MAIVTKFAIPELVEIPTSPGSWSVDFEAAPLGDTVSQIVFECTTPGGDVWLAIFRHAGGFVLRFPDIADFVVTPADRRIECVALGEVGAGTLRHLLLDQVVPHVLAHEGALVIHASAVAAKAGALGFMGPSGYGKSTLAASFIEAGWELLADDFVLLESETAGTFVARPSYPGLRLWPDSLEAFGRDAEGSVGLVTDDSDKRRVARDLVSRETVPLRALVVLGDSGLGHGTANIERLSGHEAVMAIYTQAFRVERSGSERQIGELDRFSRLAAATVVVRLDYDRDYAALPAVREMLIRYLG